MKLKNIILPFTAALLSLSACSDFQETPIR